jgi:hypothetical protein
VVAALLNRNVVVSTESFRLVGIHECLCFIRDTQRQEMILDSEDKQINTAPDPEAAAMHGYNSDDDFIVADEALCPSHSTDQAMDHPDDERKPAAQQLTTSTAIMATDNVIFPDFVYGIELCCTR